MQINPMGFCISLLTAPLNSALALDQHGDITQMTVRTNIYKMNEIPNVGPAITKDFALLNIFNPSELIGKDPYKMYYELCQATGAKHDPCVIDVFISAVRFMEGEPSRKWWYYTPERKRKLSQKRSYR